MKKKTVKPDINFFFEKTLQKHNPRGIASKPERGKSEGDPTYYILDYLSRKKKITVEDLWEMKNPSARLAKAAMSLKYTKRSPEDFEIAKEYQTVDQLQQFMQEIGLWSREEADKLAVNDNDNSEDEDMGEIEKTLREALLTKIQKATEFHQAFENLTRTALASHLKAAFLEAPGASEPRDPSEERHSKGSRAEGAAQGGPLISKDFKQYIQKTSNRDKIAYSCQQFVECLLSVYRDPMELLGFEPGVSRIKELREVLLELYGQELVEEMYGLESPILTKPASGTVSTDRLTPRQKPEIQKPSPETVFDNPPGHQIVREALSDIKKLEKDTLKHLQEIERTTFEEKSRIKKIFQKSKQDYYVQNQLNQQTLHTSDTQAGDSRPNQSELRSKKKTEFTAANSSVFQKTKEEDPLKKLVRQKILGLMQLKVSQAERYDPRVAESMKLAFKKQLEAQE